MTWAILDKNLRVVLEFTSFVSIEVKDEGSVSTMQVEKGTFAAYNKTDSPLDIRLTLAIAGTPDKTARAKEILKKLKNSTDVISILTPDDEIRNLNLQSFDYAHKNDITNSVFIPTMHLVEIREYESVYSTVAIPPAKTKNKDHASKQKTGQKQPGKEEKTSVVTDIKNSF